MLLCLLLQLRPLRRSLSCELFFSMAAPSSGGQHSAIMAEGQPSGAGIAHPIVVEDSISNNDDDDESSSRPVERSDRDVVMASFQKGEFDSGFKDALGKTHVDDGFMESIEHIAKSVHEASEKAQALAMKTTTRDDPSEGDSADDAFETCVAAKKVDPRSAIGQRFAAKHKARAVEGDKYRTIANRADAAEFRLMWARKQLQMRCESTTFLQRWRRVDTTRGTFKTLEQVIYG